MRRFVVIGQKASASAEFSLDDLPGSSGRLDVLLRCVRAALLVSHGVRKDTVVYLVLLGGAAAPRALRVDGSIAEYLRPDERSLARTVQKVLATAGEGPSFAVRSHGFALAEGGLDAVLADLGTFTPYVLDEAGPDVRGVQVEEGDPVFFVGDHAGLDETARAALARLHARHVSVGPVSLHADDAIAVVSNELDRRRAGRPGYA
jgi:tRNA (pseudouridine54-N1)-methyltransferase